MSSTIDLEQFISYFWVANLISETVDDDNTGIKTLVVRRGKYKGVVSHSNGVIYRTTLLIKDAVLGTEIIQQPGLQTIYSKMVER